MLLLTACSSAPQQPPLAVNVVSRQVAIVHPPLPAPVKLNDAKWQQCKSSEEKPALCLVLAEATKELRNKAVVGRWMSSMNGVVKYYRGLGNKPADAPKSAAPTN